MKRPKKDSKLNTPMIDATIEPDATAQADLLFLPHDKGYKYALVVVDLGSRLVDAEPLKTKDAATVRDACKAVFARPYGQRNDNIHVLGHLVERTRTTVVCPPVSCGKVPILIFKAINSAIGQVGSCYAVFQFILGLQFYWVISKSTEPPYHRTIHSSSFSLLLLLSFSSFLPKKRKR